MGEALTGRAGGDHRQLPFADEDTARAFFSENCLRVLRWH